MPRDIRDRAGRVLTPEQRKALRARARAMKKANKRDTTTGEKLQYALVVLVIVVIVFFALKLAH